MKDKPLVSIIINNYNYARFLAEAIDSALAQTYPHTEVIVVDDGSTDHSRDIIVSYGNKIIPVLKSNGGQASSLNAGFETSRGEVLFFLDADDAFYPNKVEEILNLLDDIILKTPDITISHEFEVVDDSGNPVDADILSGLYQWQYLKEIKGGKKPENWSLVRLSTPEQAIRFATRYRFIPYLGSPTSGFIVTRSLAQKLFPLPVEGVITSADDFLVKGGALLGCTYTTNRVLARYRIHGSNNFFGRKKPHQKQFFDVLDAFLNSKVKPQSKQPIFSYLNSIHAKSYYRRYYGYSCSQELFDLAIKVITWHVNLRTVNFFAKTIALAIYFKFVNSYEDKFS